MLALTVIDSLYITEWRTMSRSRLELKITPKIELRCRYTFGQCGNPMSALISRFG